MLPISTCTYRTTPLHHTLGLLATPPRLSSAMLRTSRLLTLDLLLAVCTCLVAWHQHDPPLASPHQNSTSAKRASSSGHSSPAWSASPSPGRGSGSDSGGGDNPSPHAKDAYEAGAQGPQHGGHGRVRREDECGKETLRLSLEHFLVTFTPTPTSTPSTDKSRSWTGSSVLWSAPVLHHCALHPLLAPSLSGDKTITLSTAHTQTQTQTQTDTDISSSSRIIPPTTRCCPPLLPLSLSCTPVSCLKTPCQRCFLAWQEYFRCDHRVLHDLLLVFFQ